MGTWTFTQRCVGRLYIPCSLQSLRINFSIHEAVCDAAGGNAINVRDGCSYSGCS